MNPEVATCILKTWKDAYQIALFEADKSKLAERIADAELALLLRTRELFQAKGDHIEEEAAMDDAMYALHALKSIAAGNEVALKMTGDRTKFAA